MLELCVGNNWQLWPFTHYRPIKFPMLASNFCTRPPISLDEEELLVRTIVNKNRAYQPFNRKDTNKFNVSMLKIRKARPSRVMNNDASIYRLWDEWSCQQCLLRWNWKGCSCASDENRECVTEHPMMHLKGEMMSCHVIFASSGISSNMVRASAVDNIENLLISITEHGSRQERACWDFIRS